MRAYRLVIVELVGILLLLSARVLPAQPLPELTKGDLVRIEELYHFSDRVAGEILPGFDMRTVPVAINLNDQAEFLIAHPQPPQEFVRWEGVSVGDKTVFRRKGCTTSVAGGTIVPLGGVWTVYVPAKRQGLPTEQHLLLLLHEGLHVYQKKYRPDTPGDWEEPPNANANYSAMLALESKILHEAVRTKNESEAKALCRMFIAARRERRRGLSDAVVRYEGEEEFIEGTAMYAQARALELLVRNTGITPVHPGQDPEYGGFRDASTRLEELVQMILPLPKTVVDFDHAMYLHGMAQCLLLDRFHPLWKPAISRSGVTQTQLLERACPVEGQEQVRLLEEARRRFRYDGILADQTQQIARWLEIVHGYLNAAGRRYKIYHGPIGGRFNWKPKGPLYKLGETWIWAGGIRRFERGPLVFESKEVPVIFTQEYLEWIDREPDPTGNDLKMTYSGRDGDTYTGLSVETDGFKMSVPRAMVTMDNKTFEIRPVSATREGRSDSHAARQRLRIGPCGSALGQID